MSVSEIASASWEEHRKGSAGSATRDERTAADQTLPAPFHRRASTSASQGVVHRDLKPGNYAPKGGTKMLVSAPKLSGTRRVRSRVRQRANEEGLTAHGTILDTFSLHPEGREKKQTREVTYFNRGEVLRWHGKRPVRARVSSCGRDSEREPTESRCSR